MVLDSGTKLSMDGRGAWRVDLGFCHNVFVERLWRTVKYDEVYLHAYDTVPEAKACIARFLNDYNRDRPHSSLKVLPIKPSLAPRCPRTPDEAYVLLLPKMRRAA